MDLHPSPLIVCYIVVATRVLDYLASGMSEVALLRE
jgi:hypothetical protein